MLEIAEELLTRLGLEEIERIELTGRTEHRSGIPEDLLSGPLGPELRTSHPDGLWSHQSLALRQLADGENVVVATGTASGKSLIFQYRALDIIKRNHNARVLVFYPLKALAADQFYRWKALCQRFGFPADLVAKIDGDVLGPDRERALERSSIVLMTPDVCQAWLMRNVGTPITRTFLSRLSLIILDEAHIYESVFGSNVAFLMRRLQSAKRQTSKALDESPTLQFLAATATIAEPAQHLERLTGLSFNVIAEDQNGAPQYPRLLLHVGGPSYGPGGEQMVKSTVQGILELSNANRFLAFVDSRQGTERIVRDLESREVLPYRSGYEADDRALIERSLRDESLRGVVSTSALELGIDVPSVDIGLNLGVPDSRKSFRQRIGRVGRARAGLFIIIAEPNAFRQYGQTFFDYYNGSIEPSYLYTGNRFIQFAHARCLWDEMEVLRQDRGSPPVGVNWPDNFSEAFKIAKPGGGRPREFDYIAQLGADSPHINYPLRQVGEANYEIKQGKQSDSVGRIGRIAANQALREAFPGAQYLHFGKSYRVLQWNATSFERSIRVEPVQKPAPISPLLRKTVNMSLDQGNVIDRRVLRNEKGLVAEINLQVNESVEGFRIGGKTFMYRDLRAENPNMSRKQRDIRTTGVVIMIDEPWFSGPSNDVTRNREFIGRAITGVLSRERSIEPHDVDYTWTNIALLSEQGPKRVTNCVVIYDSVYGGIRLTEEIVTSFKNIVNLVQRGAELSGDDAIVDDALADKLVAWAETLSQSEIETHTLPAAPDGWYQVFKPGSVVSTYSNGMLVTREIVSPRILDPLNDGSSSLYYSYKLNGKTGVVQHDQLQPSGDEASYVLWNPESNEFRELDDGTNGASISADGQFQKVLRPGTSIKVMRFGKLVAREIIGPRIVANDGDGASRLEYVFAEGGGHGYVPHQQLELTGPDWSYVLWEPTTNTFKEIDN